MPMKSKKQRAWMWANKPEMAKEFEKHTPKGKKLPKYAPKKKKKKSKKSKASYKALILRLAFINKEAMGAEDYLSKLNPREQQLIATLPGKNNPTVAWAALKVIEILREYYSAVASEIKNKKDPQGLVSKLIDIVKSSVGQEFEKVSSVAQHIANAIVQLYGRQPATAAIVERVDSPKSPAEALNDGADQLDKERRMEEGIFDDENEDEFVDELRFAFRKAMIKRFS